MLTPNVVLITGAGSGFGLLAAKTLAAAGHIVYGGLHSARSLSDSSTKTGALVHDIVLDITDKGSIDAAISKITSEAGRIDCLVHNAGHMGMGPAESFSAEQLHSYYEINAVGAHRLNQAVLPLMRKARRGHLIWVSSSSSRGGSGPLLAPYFAAKAAMHSLALTMSTEIACWGIETTIIVPGM
jgi:NAD(P)-dependent dehydrogenase (short-subunit alcohol dehydrogenase family)